MLGKKITRYFLFSKINPKDDDYRLIIDVCKRINACLGFRTTTCDGKTRLKGFIVLRGSRTSAGSLRHLFPNFLLTAVPSEFDFNMNEIQADVQVRGTHPFETLRRDLFKELPRDTLAGYFMNGDSSEDVHGDEDENPQDSDVNE